MRKKFITIFLILCTLSSSIWPVFTSAQTIDTKEESTIEKAKGNLEIDLKFVLPMENTKDSNIRFTLYQEEDSYQIDLNGITTTSELSYTLGNQKGRVAVRKADQYGSSIEGESGEAIYYYALTFYDLEEGVYDLIIDGDGYKTTNINDIEISKYSKRVTLTNQKGGFTVGDVNNDDAVDEKDLQAMSSFLLNQLDFNSNYDLNRDGQINTADLSMISHALYGKESKIDIINTSAILTEDLLTIEEGPSQISGSIADLIDGTGIVQISPSNSDVISEEHPAIISLNMKETVEMSEIRLDVTEDNTPQELLVEVLDENGEIHQERKSFEIYNGVDYFTDKASKNTIVIDLGKEIAVKKVTIKILKTSTSTLADISKVEFLNNVYEEVPEPVIEVPKNVKVEAESEKATVTWNELSNVTGYEVTLNKIVNGTPSFEGKYQTIETTLTLEELKNYVEYSVTVQAINGEWRSAPSSEVAFIPTPTRLPPPPEGVTLTSVSGGLNVSFQKMKDTQTYNLYYRKRGTDSFLKISDIKTNKYELRNLEPNVEYEIYITGANELGEGAKSVTVIGTARENIFPNMSPYKLINRPVPNQITEHIKDVTYEANSNTAQKYALVDHNLNTYWTANTWDIGGFNQGHAGPKVEFDQKYTMNYLDLIPFDDQSKIYYARIWYRDEDGYLKETNTKVSTLKAPNGEIYHRIYFDKVTTDLLEINLANYLAGYIGITVRDINFYEYDSLEDDLNHLFVDSLHVELENFVTEEKIDELYARTEQIDERNQVYHPNKETIQEELNYAKELLQDKAIKEVINVDTNLFYGKDTHLGFAYTTSDLQPLGIAVKKEKDQENKLVVYVGTSNESYLPQLVFTQYHAEWNAWSKVVNLKPGRNVIDIPDLVSSDLEHGGSVYVKYPYSNAANVTVKIRVSGGEKIPVLDLSKVTDEKEQKDRIETYLTELKAYVEKLKSENNATKTSVLNSTEIVTRDGLFSVAATAVYDEVVKNTSNTEEQIQKLGSSLNAFDEMMAFFYRQKGLEENPENPKDKRPVTRINIRYMTMFDGAFMYAGGGHVGIEYGSIGGLVTAKQAVKTSDGVDTSGYFGWGISHEIGHQINHKSLVHAEVTNNVYALLAQTADDKDASRLEGSYDKIYKKVTSGSKGKGSNVFVTLGMYWQLHLAYDDNKTFEDTNSIYAKINHLARTTSLTGSKDDLLVMLASEAAGKNLVSFFEAWGLTPSKEAIEYASKFEPETREIRYLNDAARRYRLENGKQMNPGTKVTAQVTNADEAKRFHLTFEVPSSEQESILGYEIKRNGIVIGFTEENEFTDDVGSMNNRALTYEVTAYDKYLNKTQATVLEEIKVNHDGSISKEAFTISSNYKEQNEVFDPEDIEMDYEQLGINKLIDGNKETIFEGTDKIILHSINENKNVSENDTEYNGKGNPYVIIDLNSAMDVTGIKYISGGSNPIQEFKVYVSKDRQNWTLAKKGIFESEENIVYFDTYDNKEVAGENSIWTYPDISYIKIEAVNQSGISGAELDIIAPPGDNIELEEIGILKDDFQYGEKEKDVLQAGTVIFKGSYRGHPAFNVGVIADENKNLELDPNYANGVYDGEFIPFATLNQEGTVYEVAKGTWLYAMTKEQYQNVVGKTIRANLLRVNDANTNKGARLTSTSLKKVAPSYEELPTIELKQNAGGIE